MAALLTIAEDAHDVALALDKFLGPVADYSAEIETLIAHCFHTSSALRTLRDAQRDYFLPDRHRLIAADLQIVTASLRYTIKDVQRIFGGLGRVGVRPGDEYRRVWRDLIDHFREESGTSLSRRLECYKRFLDGLTDTLVDGYKLFTFRISSRDIDDFPGSLRISMTSKRSGFESRHS